MFFVIIFANALFGFYVVKIAFGFLFVFIWFNISIQKRCSWPFSTNFQPAESWIYKCQVLAKTGIKIYQVLA